MQSEQPSDLGKEFSWVRARAECSVASVYERIKLQVEADVAQRKEIIISAGCERLNFSIDSNGSAFTVTRVEPNSHRSVTFRTTAKGITVVDGSDNVVLEGTLTLGDDGRCRLKVSGRDLDFWQFRRTALEELFF